VGCGRQRLFAVVVHHASLQRPQNPEQKRWSEWVESMRKDVECFFGILKGRWRILKVGMRFRGNAAGLETVDNVWKTCCALHNWLLDSDGYDPAWRGAREHIPDFILDRMPNQGRDWKSRMEYDSSHKCREPWISKNQANSSSTPVQRTGAFHSFRHRLVAHFDYKFARHLVGWPALLQIFED